MSKTDYTHVTMWEDAGVTLMARVIGADATAVQIADISSIARNIYNHATGVALGTVAAPVVADTIFDTLQTDARWTADTTGYNFADVIDDDKFVTPGIYEVEYKLVPAAEADIMVLFLVTVKPVRAS